MVPTGTIKPKVPLATELTAHTARSTSHISCMCVCSNCSHALEHGAQLAVSMALIHRPPALPSEDQRGVEGEGAEGREGGGASGSSNGAALAAADAWLVDCGPDIKTQWRMLQNSAPGCRVRGVFLTHLHMGHYM